MKKLLMTGVLVTLSMASMASAVKVGVLIPLTGAGSVSGQAAKNGFQLALDEINKAGGVLGKPLELVISDDGSAAAKAVPEFVKLVTVDKVDFMAGGVSSATSIAISGPAKQYNTFMAWMGAAAVPVEDAFADHKYFFHYHPWAYYNFEAVIDYFKSLRTTKKARNIAIAYEDGPFGSAGIDATIAGFKKAGFNVVMSEKFKAGSGSFGPIVTKAKSLNPDILYWIGYDVDALPLVTEVKQQNLKVGLIYGTPPSWPVGFEKNKLSENVGGLSLWLPTSPNQPSRQFVAAYRKKYNNITEEYMAPLAYVNLKTLAAAINKAGSTDKDKVAEELAKTNVATPFGQLTFSPSLKTRYQGFKTGSWLSFQYTGGDDRVPVYPLKFAKKTTTWSK